MEIEDFTRRLAEHFGPAVRAISVKADFDFFAVVQTKWANEDGDIVAFMWPDFDKSFYLQITKIEIKGDEWWLTIPGETWVFRKIADPAIAKAFVEEMAEEGISA